MKLVLNILTVSIFTAILTAPKTQAQIIANPSDTNTVVNESGNTFTITGGTQVDKNVFHSLQKFGLSENQIADFVTNPGTQNVLGRITGGDASVINGLIKVSGSDANLYLMNPAGIIFGSGASLDVPGSFTATTANGVGFGDKWFNAVGANNYADLVGEPDSFAFTMSQPGAIANFADLALNSGETLTLLGGTVINTGTLSSKGGNINIVAIPGKKLVRVTQEGSLLSLGLPTSTENNLNPVNFNPLSLPQLLTGGNLNNATGVRVENGIIKLTGSGVAIPNDSGTAIVSRKVDVSGEIGGNVNILGEKVGVVDANINASGENGGGTVLIGGDYKGEGTVPNAQRTFISRDSVIKADAEVIGNGGKVIAWADKTTSFYGNISARGGKNSGDGGFVEVSGKENLAFDGFVDVGADFGKGGELLLDPATVEIGTDDDDDSQLNDQEILSTDPGEIFKISASTIEDALGKGNVAIEATDKIDVNSNIDKSNGGNLTLDAPSINIDKSTDIKVVGDLNLKASNNLQIEDSNLQADGDINIESQLGNLTLTATELYSLGNIQLKSPKSIKLTEQSNKPSITVAKGNITIEGAEGIEIEAFENTRITKSENGLTQIVNQQSILRSGGDLSLISDNNIIANARISSGGNFSAGSGNFSQPALKLNGIISSNGDVSFGNYTGSSLKVEAKGSIRGGNINITQAGTFTQNDDPDINILNAGPAIILRVGLENLEYSDENLSNSIEGTAFTLPEGESPAKATLPGSIEVGDIKTTTSPISVGNGFDSKNYLPTDSVILSADGEIITGAIETANGSVKLTTNKGDIIVEKYIDTYAFSESDPMLFSDNGGGNVDVKSGGIFQVQGTFDFSPNGGGPLGGVPEEQKVSIRTVYFINEDPNVGGNINIEHTGEQFEENYSFNDINENINGTKGRVFITGGGNGQIYGSLIDEELFEQYNQNDPNKKLPHSNKIQVTSVSKKIPIEVTEKNPETQPPSTEKSSSGSGTSNGQGSTGNSSSNGTSNGQESTGNSSSNGTSNGQESPGNSSGSGTSNGQESNGNSPGNGTSNGGESNNNNSNNQKTPDGEIVQRQLNQDEQNEVCSPQSQTIAINKTENTRGSTTVNNSQSSNNNPCKTASDNNNILKVIPDNRLDSNSALPTLLFKLGQQ